jgi:hypothetical protein
MASQVKNSQAEGASKGLLNNACKQLLHTQAQWSSTQLQEGPTLRNNTDNNSNFAMPCKELAYPIRTFTHAFTPPETPSKRGKWSTVALQVKNSLEEGASRGLLNNACKKLLHTQAQWSDTQLQEGTTLRNRRDNHSNFTMPCKELAYPIKTVTHAFTPPDTPEKGGKARNSYRMERNNSERDVSLSSSNIPLHMEMS